MSLYFTNLLTGYIDSQCDASSLTTQQGETVGVNCISSGNNVIWYIYPTK